MRRIKYFLEIIGIPVKFYNNTVNTAYIYDNLVFGSWVPYERKGIQTHTRCCCQLLLYMKWKTFFFPFFYSKSGKAFELFICILSFVFKLFMGIFFVIFVSFLIWETLDNSLSHGLIMKRRVYIKYPVQKFYLVIKI